MEHLNQLHDSLTLYEKRMSGLVALLDNYLTDASPRHAKAIRALCRSIESLDDLISEVRRDIRFIEDNLPET